MDTIFTTLRADLGKLRQDLKRARQLASESIELKPIRVTVDQASATREARRTVKTIRDVVSTAKIKINIESKPVRVTVDQASATREARRTAKTISDAVSTAKIKLNIDRDAINRQFAKPLKINAQIVANRASMAGLTKAQRVRMQISTPTINSSQIDRATASIKNKLRTLELQAVRIGVRANTAEASDRISALMGQIRAANGSVLKIKGKADLGQVHRELERIKDSMHEVRKLDITTRKIQASQPGGGQPSTRGGFFSGAGGRFFGGAGIASFMGGGQGAVLGAGVGAVAGGTPGAVAGGMAGAAAGAGVGFAAGGVSQLANLERMASTFDVLLGDRDATKSLIADLQKIDLELPVDMGTLTDAAVKMAAAGFNQEKILRSIVPLLDAAAVSPVGIDEGMSRLVRAISQIQSKGKLQAEELLQLQEVGIPAGSILSEQFGGRKIDEIAKDSQSGKIPIDEIIDKLIAGFGAKFGGTLEAQSKKLGGQLDQLGDRFRAAQRKVAEPLIEPLTEALEQLNQAIDVGAFTALTDAMIATAQAAVSASVTFGYAMQNYQNWGDRDKQRGMGGKEDIAQYKRELKASGIDAPIEVKPNKDIAKVQDERVKNYLRSIQTRQDSSRDITPQEKSDLEEFRKSGTFPTIIPDAFARGKGGVENDFASAEFFEFGEGRDINTRDATPAKPVEIDQSAQQKLVQRIQQSIELGIPVSSEELEINRRFKETGELPSTIPEIAEASFPQPIDQAEIEAFDPADTSAIDEAGQRLADALDTITDDIAGGSPRPSETTPNAPEPRRTETASTTTSGPVDVKVTTDVDVSGSDDGPVKPDRPAEIPETVVEAPKVNVTTPEPTVVTVPPRTSTADPVDVGPSETLTSYTAPDAIEDLAETLDRPASGAEMDSASIVDAIEENAPAIPVDPPEVPGSRREASQQREQPAPEIEPTPIAAGSTQPVDIEAPRANQREPIVPAEPIPQPDTSIESVVDAIVQDSAPTPGDNRTEAERIADIQTQNRADYQQKNADAIREQSKRETEPAVRAAMEYEAEKLDYQARSLRSSIPSPERTGEDRKVQEYAAALEGNQQDRDRRQSNIEFLASAPPEVQAAITNNQIGDEDPVFPSMVPDPRAANPLPSTDEVRQYWYPDEPAPQTAPAEPPQAVTPNAAPVDNQIVDNRTADERAFDEQKIAEQQPRREKAAELRAKAEALAKQPGVDPAEVKAAKYWADAEEWQAGQQERLTPSPEFTGAAREQERERLTSVEIDDIKTRRLKNKWMLKDASESEQQAIWENRPSGNELTAFPMSFGAAQEPDNLPTPQEAADQFNKEENEFIEARKSAMPNDETLVSVMPPVKPDPRETQPTQEQSPAEPTEPVELPQAAAVIDDVLNEVVRSSAPTLPPPEIDNRTEAERAFDSKPMSESEQQAQYDAAQRQQRLMELEADPNATPADINAARYAMEATSYELDARDRVTPSPELTGEERDAEQKRLVAKETNRQKRLREQNIKKLEQATPEERAAIFAAMPESTEAFPRSVEEGQQIDDSALTAPERLENLQADEAAFTADQQAAKQADEQASEAKTKEAKQAERAARIEEQRATIIEADTKAIDLRKQASETEDPAKKKALEYAADAAEFESEQARNMILPEGLTEAEEKEELAKRKAENLRREGDRLVENTRDVGMASESERAAIAEQQIDSKAFPTKAEPEDFFAAEQQRAKLNQQATQVEKQQEQTAITDKNDAANKAFAELQKTLPKQFEQAVDDFSKGDNALKERLKALKPTVTQETDENGVVSNRVDIARPELQRPEAIQYSGVAEIGKLVQSNINNGEMEIYRKQLDVAEKMEKHLNTIAKKPTAPAAGPATIAAG